MSEQAFDSGRADLLRAQLLDWFDLNARTLPWRGISDPYATWVSEIMLQQTQVATVIDYFERWMETFPTVHALAAADLDDVLGQWQGLGYYRRARYLHKGARMVVEELDGELPSTVPGLKKIPGIGPYTAGAIASIAFDRPAPIVDGNVTRVLSRLQALDVQPRDRADQKLLWALAEELVPQERPGDFNQSLMELGATVCTPANPACLVCPVRAQCEGFATGDPTEYPRVATRTKVRSAAAKCAIVTRASGREVLVEQRPDTGLLAGLWQFPCIDDGSMEELEAKLSKIGVASEWGEEVGEVTHRFSHIEMTIEVVRYSSVGEPGDCTGASWVPWSELDELAFSAAMRKVEKVARAHIG